MNDVYDVLVADPTNPLYNRAIGGDLNPPGSTFKLVVASAALASGDYTPQSTLPEPGRRTRCPALEQRHPQRERRHVRTAATTVTIADALRLSCNIPIAELAVQLGDDAIREEAEKYGFNSSFTMPLDLDGIERIPRALDDPQTALTGFGQGAGARPRPCRWPWSRRASRTKEWS